MSASHTITGLFQASECTVDPSTLRSGGKFRKFADWEHVKQTCDAIGARQLLVSTQGSYVSDDNVSLEYELAQTPMAATTNAGPNPGPSQRWQRSCPRDVTATTPAQHLHSLAMRIAVRDAECILAPSPSGGIPRPGRMTNWRNSESKRLSG